MSAPIRFNPQPSNPRKLYAWVCLCGARWTTYEGEEPKNWRPAPDSDRLECPRCWRARRRAQ